MRNATFAALGLVTILAAGSGIVGHEIVPGFLHPYRAPMSTRMLARVDAMLERMHAAREDFDVPLRTELCCPVRNTKPTLL